MALKHSAGKRNDAALEAVKARLRALGATPEPGASASATRWAFKDGAVFVFERKTGNPVQDARVATRRLNVFLTEREAGADVDVRASPDDAAANVDAARVDDDPPAPAPVPGRWALAVTAQSTLRDQWAAALVAAEAVMDACMHDAALAERRCNMLRALEPYIGEEMFADTLRALLPAPPPPPPPAATPPPPVVTRTAVTRDLVLAAANTFGADETFTVNDVLEVLLNGRVVDRFERLRIRASIASTMLALRDRGHLTVEQQGGRGRSGVSRQTLWSRGEAGTPVAVYEHEKNEERTTT